MQQLHYLKQFHPVSDEDLSLLYAALKPKAYAKGSLIVSPGEVQQEMLFVESGVQMSYIETDENIHVIAFTYAPGLCVVPGSFSFRQASGSYVKCMTASEFRAIGYEALQDLFDRSPALERLFRKITEAVLAGMISRHIELKTMSIEERFRTFCGRSPHLLQMLPHKHIASYLDIDPTNFSKLFNSIRL